MKIGSIGYNYVHDMKYENFVMDRPKGPGAVLLLFIKTPAVFKVGEVQYQVKENSFILLSADTPCFYTAQGDVYTDDWVYFENEFWDKDYVEKLGIPMDIPVYLGDIDELSHLVHILVYEHYSGAVNSDEIEKKYIDVLFLMLSRTLRSCNCMSSKQLSERHYRFTQIRTLIFTMPDQVGNVDDLAAQAGMSRSGFQHLYKKLFGTTVIKDIIEGSTQRAKRLLSSTRLTIKDIGTRCGYTNEYSFMRQFKEQVGKTPTEYRSSI